METIPKLWLWEEEWRQLRFFQPFFLGLCIGFVTSVWWLFLLADLWLSWFLCLFYSLCYLWLRVSAVLACAWVRKEVLIWFLTLGCVVPCLYTLEGGWATVYHLLLVPPLAFVFNLCLGLLYWMFCTIFLLATLDMYPPAYFGHLRSVSCCCCCQFV